jgi:hypothetical protein
MMDMFDRGWVGGAELALSLMNWEIEELRRISTTPWALKNEIENVEFRIFFSPDDKNLTEYRAFLIAGLESRKYDDFSIQLAERMVLQAHEKVVKLFKNRIKEVYA